MQQLLNNGQREGPAFTTSWSGQHLIALSDLPRDQYLTVQFKSVRKHWIDGGEAYTFRANGLYTVNLCQGAVYRVRCDPGRGANVTARALDCHHSVLQEGISLVED